MVLFNHATREMTAKIVYYGPGLCGKTTNLMVIFDKLDPKSKGKMLSLATKTDRTLFFDLLPVDIGKVGPFNLKIQLYTVPGQVFYNETRKLVLKGADSVVFVADSQPAMVEANRESFANLIENLRDNQIDPDTTPIVVQFNKRDIPGVLSIDELQKQLALESYPFTEASAIQGSGVMETFKLVSKITAKHLFHRLKGGKKDTAKRTPAAARVESRPRLASVMDAMVDSESLSAAPNDFPDVAPFAGVTAVEADYDTAEEVSLEQLLAEGRSRPSTLSGHEPLPPVHEEASETPDPDEEIEELGAADLEVLHHDDLLPVAEDAPSALNSRDTEPASGDSRVSALEERIAAMEQKLESRQRALESILRELDGLRDRVNADLDA